VTAIAYDAGSPGLRLDLIIRTSKRKKEARSPQQQRDMAESSCRSHGNTIVHVHDSGTDESGKTMDRTSINAAMRRVQLGLSDGVIVALADRIGRAKIEESMAIVRQFCLAGKLVIADMGGQPIDLNEPANETNVVMQLQFARQYWLATANRNLRSQRDAIRAGRWIGKAPLGFVKVKAGPDKGKLAKGPHWTVMRDCYRLVGRDGLDAGVRFMQRMVPERHWDGTELRRTLACRAYRGELRYGDIGANLEAHDWLVTENEWLAAQTDSRGRAPSGDYVLSGLIHCQCGGELKGGLQTVKARGYSYRRYRCATCNRSSIRAEGLEEYVRAVLAHNLGNEGFRARFGADGLEQAREAFEAARSSRRALTDKVDPSDPDFETWKAKADARVAAAQAEHQRLALLTNEAETLPYAHELDKPDAFLRGLRAVSSVGRFVVAYAAKGARIPVEDRVSYVLNV
jgi:hypothetical protein